jgi:TPR repeat protein
VKFYLRSGNDYLEDAVEFSSKAAAVRYYRSDAEELDRIGQRHEASIHIAEDRDKAAEYPDFVLSLGPRGGVKIERA